MARSRFTRSAVKGFWHGVPLRYGMAVVAVAAATLVRYGLEAVAGDLGAAFITYYPAVLLIAVITGGGPGILATALSALAVASLFMPPPGIGIASPGHIVSTTVFVATCSAMCFIAEMLRRKRWVEAFAIAKEQEAASLSKANEVLTRLQNDMSERARLLDLSHEAIFVRDAHDRITYWNKGAEEMYGYTAEEALGQKPRELLRTEFPLPVETVFESLKRDGRWSGEIVHTRKDGQKITVATRWALDRDAQGSVDAVLEINSDITAHKQTIEALAASEQSVRRKIQSVLSPEGELGDLDLADVMDVPTLQALMEDFYTLTRFPMALIDVKGKVLVKVGWQRICTQFHRTHPEICKHCVESDTELTTNVPPGEFRLYKCKNGLWDVATPVMVGGRHVGNIFTGQFFLDDDPVNLDFFRSQARRYGLDEEAYLAAIDAVPHMNRQMVNICMAFLSRLSQTVSHLSYSNIKLARSLVEGQRLTDSLRQSELFYRQTLESIPGMVFTTRPDGYCDYQSQQWVDFTGVPMSQHVGEGWNRLLHPDDQPRALAAWQAAVEGRAPYDLEYRVRGRDGHYAWFKVLGKPIRDAEGHIVRWFGVAANIDAIKKNEEELRRMAEDLRRSNRDLEQFAYVASHDLQEPLRQTAAFTGLLRDRYQDKLDEQGRQYCNFVIEGAQRMQDLVKGLLEYSRVDSRGAVPEPADSREAVQAAISSLRTSIEESGAQISIGELPAVQADKCQLMQVFQNLLGNAIKFRSDRPPLIEVGASSNEEHWLFWVKDNGIGLDEKYREKIFIIFQRLHTRVEIPGAGIGLSICKKIVESHGGRIWVESRPGEGATFFFTVPAVRHPSGHASG